jgi:predicted DNA-binding transcriptional regulator AlpA
MQNANAEEITPIDATPRALMDVRQAAQRLHLSTSTLNKLRLVGGGPRFIKLGRAVRYEDQAISEWIAAQRRRSTSDVGGTHG